ncbi:MAG: CocE/NonD family hydrolase [Betaproteobacteria bacterium]|nr:CocE/NonD family hydrolase [Betaproteobacteria bacterium]
MAERDSSGTGPVDIPFTPGFPPGVGRAHPVHPSDTLVMDCNVRVPMRDGGWIAADVYRPRAHSRHPVLLVASGYPKKLDHLPSNPAYRFRETSDFEWWVAHGYAIVRTDARGTGESTDGQWDFFGPGEQSDLYDSIEWAAAQSWANGRVGMLGQSYFAQVQWLAAVNRPPSLACIAPYDGLVDIYRDLAWHGGMFSQDFVANWAARQIHLNNLPFEPAPPGNVMRFDVTGELIRHRLDGPFYRARSAFWRLDQIAVPVYSIGAWEKVRLHTRGNVLGYERISHVPRKLLMLGGDAQATFHTEPLMRELERWYARWLKGADNGIEREPPVRIYVQGKNPGFRDENEWPIARTRVTELYLRPDGLGPEPPASENERSLEYPRNDFLRDMGAVVFETAPLDADIEVTGPIKLVLFVSSDQPEADIAVTLAERSSAGSTVVTRGWQKASQRVLEPSLSTLLRPFHPHQSEEPLVPGEVYEVEIEIWPTSWRFARSNRIALSIANGDRTHFYGFKAGRDSYHFGGRFPSRLLLPVIPA